MGNPSDVLGSVGQRQSNKADKMGNRRATHNEVERRRRYICSIFSQTGSVHLHCTFLAFSQTGLFTLNLDLSFTPFEQIWSHLGFKA